MRVKKGGERKKSALATTVPVVVDDGNNNDDNDNVNGDNGEKTEGQQEGDDDVVKNNVVVGGGDQKQEQGNGEERPKLDEGYYEIEAVRRKRVRKGQVQYLIKWRGWPETANTWEPLSNLQACSDFVDQFEESLSSGKQRKRKRKLKQAITNSQSKKKQELSSSAGISRGRGKTSGSANELSLGTPGLAPEGTTNAGAVSVETTKASQPTGETGEDNEQNLRNELLEKAKEQNANGGSVIDNGTSAVNGATPVPSTRSKGSRRRKPESVKRFRKDAASNGTAVARDLVPDVSLRGGGTVAPGVVTLSQDDKTGEVKNALILTEIIKPVSFTASVANNVQDVEVKFLVRRSDGAEVMVDNKYLKDHNPLLLISFYERHLKYSMNAD